ncbi:hypothetical protein HNR65_000938 [Desulfosalsimonas propionicica]|jgi:hypothetical protein|uniref:Uncharacterized protein n=1 Tax=Desulfosalsimonas propionicica TaxID=332175 RepID=A0A7W0C7I7_9BACT|nr:hypothetical protein [Desulfosalsimonas propionicica]MBA2880620.1 hypothetical protein [Desulfosalsimonas propionicica]
MSKRFRPENSGESRLISRIETSKEYERRRAIHAVGEVVGALANAISAKLLENRLVETNNAHAVREQLEYCLERLSRADDFDIDFQIAPMRNLVANPHVVTLYVTAFVIEQLIKHPDIIDIYGSDEEIYACIHRPVIRHLMT